VQLSRVVAYPLVGVAVTVTVGVGLPESAGALDVPSAGDAPVDGDGPSTGAAHGAPIDPVLKAPSV
jgi:hypothetical protein